MNESQGLDHFGEALGVLQEAGDQVLGLADRDVGDDVDRPGGGYHKLGEMCRLWWAKWTFPEEGNCHAARTWS